MLVELARALQGSKRTVIAQSDALKALTSKTNAF